MYIIAGLGNPGRKYAHTRHNAGFDALDVIAEKHSIEINQLKFNAMYGTGYIEGQKVILVKPLTFMNLSGNAIRPFVDFFKLDAEEELIVIYDDVALDPGFIRVRKKGSAGGHNGIKDIIEKTGTEKFKRVRIGVGEKPKDWDLADYVLGHLSKAERMDLEDAFDDACDAVSLIVADDIDSAMNKYNKKKKVEDENLSDAP